MNAKREPPPLPPPLTPLIDAHTHLDACGARTAEDVRAILDRAGAAALAPTRRAQDEINADLQRHLSGTVFSTGGCQSWYLDAHGVNRTLWSGMTWQYWLATRKFKASEYEFTRRRAAVRS